MTVSHTEMSTFLTCQRKHELAYHSNLQRIPSGANKARYYGTAFHAAMAYNLFYYNKPLKERVLGARKAADDAIRELTIQNKVVRNSDGIDVIDHEYYNMILEIKDAMPYILDYAIPKIDFERYRPIRFGELMETGKPSKDTQYVIEWKFQYGDFTGIIDCVLFDNVLNEYVLVDWKLRYVFPNDDAASLDGQLPFYAAILNEMGASITKTIMWQFRRNPPQPARINKNGTPSIAAQSTTFEYWWSTLPSDLQKRLDRNEWALLLEDKVKSERDFCNQVVNEVTPISSSMALQNAELTLKAINTAKQNFDNGIPAPALLGGQTCQYCDFFKICSTIRYGQNPKDIIALEYQSRTNEDLALDTD